LSIGRVQTPTLAMIVEREQKIRDFVKEPFYTVEIEGAGFAADREKLKDKTQAEAIRAACDGKTAIIQSVEKHEKSTQAPKLYDLTTLQREANKMFGYTAKQTLEVAQKLYEMKILTYPRTDSRFITEDMFIGIPALAAAMPAILPFHADIGNINTQSIVNNAKVTDHHAIIPTSTAATADVSGLSTAERNILLMVCTRLLSAVAPKHVYAETVVTVECEGETFTAKGKTVIQNGWKAIEQAFAAIHAKKNKDDTNKTLPTLDQGHEFPVKSTIREGFSQPPRHYTEDTILSAMENAGAAEMPEDAERKGIGTPATRADTLETLIKREYIVRKDKQLIPTEKGFNLIKVLPNHDPVKSPILTAEWESDLKRVERGEITDTDFMAAISRHISDTVTKNKVAVIPAENKALFPQSAQRNGEIIGICPRCCGDVSESPKTFSCAKNCGFVLWKENKYFSSKKKSITKAVAKALLTDGRIFMKDLHSAKTGKKYSATIILDDKGEGHVSFRMEFEQKGKK